MNLHRRQIPLAVWYEFALAENQKSENKIYKLWKFDHRTQVLQLAKSRSNKQKETKIWIKDGFLTWLKAVQIKEVWHNKKLLMKFL